MAEIFLDASYAIALASRTDQHHARAHELAAVPLSEDLFTLAADLYKRYTDKEWGLTDCVSFVLMRERGIQEALTADTDFRQAGFRALLLSD